MSSTSELRLVCPCCHVPLEPEDGGLRCLARTSDDCHGLYPFEDGVVNLIIGQRFDDETDEACMCYEETSNEYTAKNYWLPLFSRLFPEQADGRRARILAVGCGTGLEVDLLNEAGFDCYGIDNGNRTQAWSRRSARERLFLANGMRLPFADESFDAVFCGCVFPHVGVVGDSNIVAEHGLGDRQALASEMSRVLKPGGRAVLSSPNRKFPFDIFHGREPGSYRPRYNPPGSRFLLSLDDYAGLFRNGGCRQARALPIDGYWGFVRSRHSLKGILFGLPIRLVFKLVSTSPLRFLRTSPISPWLVVEIVK